MENKKICQSCSMPMDDPELAGTERNGMPSNDFCKYCYQQGAFVNPGMTLEEMQSVVKTMMEGEQIPADTIALAVNNLPYLKRWRNISLEYNDTLV